MSRRIKVPVESLTPDSFAAFGEVIDELPDSVHAEGGFKAARRVRARNAYFDSTSSTPAAFTNPPGADSAVLNGTPEGGGPWMARHSAAHAGRFASAAVKR